MPSPPTKKRRLSPVDDDSVSDSFVSFSEDEGPNGLHSNGFHDMEEVDSGNVGGSGNEASDANSNPKDGIKSGENSSAMRQTVARRRRTEARPNELADGIAPFVGGNFKSNLFKLQVDDLLAQVKPRYTHKDKAIERVLRTLKAIIEEIPSKAPTSISEAEAVLRRTSNVTVPFPEPRPPKDTNLKVQYKKPTHINTVGSLPLNTWTKSGDDIVIDLVVTMPAELFQEKDYLNYRYFYKRAFYLSCLASGIKSHKDQNYKLTFDHLHGNQLLPILVVEITQGTHSTHNLPCKNCKIVVLPSIPEGLFPKEKLTPSRNCVRSKDTEEAKQTQAVLPTPFYNASLSVDGLVTSYLKLQHETAKQFEVYKDACVLGRIWLRQRGFNGRMQGGGFGNFEWAILSALLLKGGGVNDIPVFSAGYSSYQLFKAALQYLATKDLAKNPQAIGGRKPEIADSAGSPVFFDGDRGINLLFKMTPWSYRLLKHEAKASIAILSDTAFDHFSEVFILRSDRLLLRYDVVAEIPSSQIIDDAFVNQLDVVARLSDLYQKLTEGLADRVTLVTLHLPEDGVWPIGSKKPSGFSGSISLGFLLDPANAQRLIDHGPAAEDKPAASKFRKFWGQQAELRRFRDGSILETVIWPAKTETRFSVFRRVLSYILERHFGKSSVENMSYNGDADCELLPQAASSSISANTALFQPMMEAFRALEQSLRALEDMPLQIRHLLAKDSYLSYSSVEVPFIPRMTMRRPADVILQFEGSARWPDDLDAIQRTKMAFFLKIAQLLESSSDGLRARVGLENEDFPLINQAFLDVHYFGDSKPMLSGAAFRIRIHHDRELTLLERQMKDKSLSNAERLEFAHGIATYKRVFIKEPATTQALQTLATRFPAFSGTVRLLEKWIASHNLSNHFSPYLVSLFAARVFTSPYPWNPASSPQAGFYRTLLLLSRWAWRTDPWIVDLGSDMRAPDVEILATRFEAWRKIDPALNRVVVFAASNVDGDGNTWTDNARPAKVTAGRVVALAKAAAGLIADDGINLVPDALFESDLVEYDFVIYLDTKLVRPARPKAAKNGYKNLELQSQNSGVAAVDTASIGFDPARLFLTDLEKTFGDAVLLFYDDLVMDVIPALWNPSYEERAWKLSLGYSAIPTAAGEDGFRAKLNKKGILNEIARLGGELVKKIEVRNC